ncbi:MAG: hypothetical protein IKL06_03000 [Lachnospiraceae bacterium]|nr:hypothetical protein [Lachnospiraceae bacterium]
MIALKLPEVRVFMNKLLCTETFDNFLLQEAAIQGSISYHIEGTLHKDFYSEEELEQEHLNGLSFIPYGKVRTQCFDLIKGKRTPSFFKFVLLLSPTNLEKTLQQSASSLTSADVTAAFINLKFQNNSLLLTTGISYRTFTIDKSLDHEWDNLIKKFLKNHEIVFEEL